MEEKKLTIGIFVDSYFPMIDGVVMVVHNYAKRLAEKANVIVFCPSFIKEYDDTQFNYKIVRSRSLKIPFIDYRAPLPRLTNAFKKALRTYKLDLVHIHSPFAVGRQGALYAKKHNIPSICTLHSQHKRDLFEHTRSKLITHFILSKMIKTIDQCEHLFAVNQKMSDLYVEYGVKKVPGVLLNATDMLPLGNVALVNELKQKHHITDQKILLYIGRLDITKNIYFTAKVLKALSDKGFNYKMIFVGAGPQMTKLQTTIAEYGITNRVDFTGRIYERENIQAYFKMADLMVFPSEYDASSLVQIEASSQKTATIFAKDSITSSTITPEVNGYEAPLDVDIFSNKIIEIFKNEEKHAMISQRAFDDLYYHWDQKVSEVYDYYVGLIEASKRKNMLK